MKERLQTQSINLEHENDGTFTNTDKALIWPREAVKQNTQIQIILHMRIIRTFENHSSIL